MFTFVTLFSLCNNFSDKGKMHFQKSNNIRKHISTSRITTNSCPSWNKMTFLLSLAQMLQSHLIDHPDFDLVFFQFIFHSILLYQFTHNNQKVLKFCHPNYAKFHWAASSMTLEFDCFESVGGKWVYHHNHEISSKWTHEKKTRSPIG